jgi:hypothetical protein
VALTTSSGNPAIAGAYNNSDETGIPFERPAEFADRMLESITPEELVSIQVERQDLIERKPTLSEFPGATSPMFAGQLLNRALVASRDEHLLLAFGVPDARARAIAERPLPDMVVPD